MEHIVKHAIFALRFTFREKKTKQKMNKNLDKINKIYSQDFNFKYNSVIESKEMDYQLTIQLYAEIIYNALQANPNLYNELIPKSSFKLIEVKEIEQYQEIKIAA